MQGRCRAVLLRVALISQPAVNAPASAQQDLLERRAEVAVETGVDDRIEKTVGETQPQKEAGEPDRDGVAATAVLLPERSD